MESSMKTLSNLIATIEGTEFEIGVMVLSGFSHLLRVLTREQVIQDLITLQQSSPDASQRVWERVQTLLADNPEPEYRHPHDAALTGYLYALSEVNVALTQQAIESVFMTPNLWWAKRMAQHLKERLAEQPDKQVISHSD